MGAFINILASSVWAGIAAVGFAVLFNAPKRALITVFGLGAGAGIIKFGLMHIGLNVILSSFLAAVFVGILSMPLSHRIHKPPVVFSIPPVIPMIPGYFAYETVLSIMKFTFVETDPAKKIDLINAIFHNGFTMLFVLMAITIGVSFPMLLLRRNSVKKLEA